MCQPVTLIDRTTPYIYVKKLTLWYDMLLIKLIKGKEGWFYLPTFNSIVYLYQTLFLFFFILQNDLPLNTISVTDTESNLLGKSCLYPYPRVLICRVGDTPTVRENTGMPEKKRKENKNRERGKELRM